MTKKIAFVVNNSEYFITHRIKIGLALLAHGYDVSVIAPGSCPSILSSSGFKFHSVTMSRNGANLFSELKTLLSLYFLFRKIRPDIVHLVTIKAYLYGGIAARLANVPAIVSAIAGLGLLFSDKGIRHQILRSILYPLFVLSFGHKNQAVIFQNADDKRCLDQWGILNRAQLYLIKGAGVDLNEFDHVPEQLNTPVVTFASRLLRDKGVLEFVEAARLLKLRKINAVFWLVGTPDPGNVNSISSDEISNWHETGLINYLGHRKDIPRVFAKSNIITLPSYYGEGLPKVLIEAAACGRAVVTTDHPGCRDAILPGETGILVPTRNASALADALAELLLNEPKRRVMGNTARDFAEVVFDVSAVVEKHFEIYNCLLSKEPSKC